MHPYFSGHILQAKISPKSSDSGSRKLYARIPREPLTLIDGLMTWTVGLGYQVFLMSRHMTNWSTTGETIPTDDIASFGLQNKEMKTIPDSRFLRRIKGKSVRQRFMLAIRGIMPHTAGLQANHDSASRTRATVESLQFRLYRSGRRQRNGWTAKRRGVATNA